MTTKTANSALQKKKLQPISFHINKIELVDSKVADNYVTTGTAELVLKIAIDIFGDLDKSNLKIQIGITILNDTDQEFIMSIVASTHFYIDNLKNYIVNKMFVNKNFIEYIADISLSHLRGMQAMIIKDTKFSTLYVPVLDLSRIRDEKIQ